MYTYSPTAWAARRQSIRICGPHLPRAGPEGTADQRRPLRRPRSRPEYWPQTSARTRIMS